MISLAEIFTGLYGAYRLARFDAAGMGVFDTSLTGFWRSFFAAVIVAPFYLLLLAIRLETLGDVSAFRFMSIETIAYVIAWVAFPLIMFTVTKAIDREDNYLGYIVAYNWAAVLQNGLYLPIAILATSHMMPEGAATVFGVIALTLILFYVWFVTRTALGVTSAMAAGIVGLDFLLSVFINAVADGMV